eukprot:SAG31_NODE_11379_length_1037_cov_1.037313_2_plen_183_part_00
MVRGALVLGLVILFFKGGSGELNSVGPSSAPAPACRFTFQHNFCGAGAPVISSTPDTSPAECCAKCTADALCKSWTVNNANEPSTCYLKAFAPDPSIGHHASGCTSGTDPYIPPPPPPPLPPLPPAPPGALNVLFLASDDLRPELGAYDWKHAPKTPNLCGRSVASHMPFNFVLVFPTQRLN